MTSLQLNVNMCKTHDNNYGIILTASYKITLHINEKQITGIGYV